MELRLYTVDCRTAGLRFVRCRTPPSKDRRSSSAGVHRHALQGARRGAAAWLRLRRLRWLRHRRSVLGVRLPLAGSCRRRWPRRSVRSPGHVHTVVTSPPRRRVNVELGHCDEYVCLSVCLSARAQLGPPLTALRYVVYILRVFIPWPR